MSVKNAIIFASIASLKVNAFLTDWIWGTPASPNVDSVLPDLYLGPNLDKNTDPTGGLSPFGEIISQNVDGPNKFPIDNLLGPNYLRSQKEGFLGILDSDMATYIEGDIYEKVAETLSPIRLFIRGNSVPFAAWDDSELVIMPKETREAILKELNNKLKSKEDIEAFWKSILGVYLQDVLAGLKEKFTKLDEALEARAREGINKADKHIYDQKKKFDTNFKDAINTILVALNLGLSNHENGMYRDVYSPFLVAVSIFKHLKQQVDGLYRV